MPLLCPVWILHIHNHEFIFINSLTYESLKSSISIWGWWWTGREMFFCVLGLDVFPEQHCSLLVSPVFQFLILSFFEPLPLNLPLKHDLFFPPSLPFFFHNFKRVILVSRFAFSWSWNLLCALFELFHSSSELHTIPPLLFPRVRLPWCFSLYPKDSRCFLKNFPRIKWHLQKSIKWCLKSLQRRSFLPHSF